MKRLLVATRSSHKLSEIRELLREISDLRLLDLRDAGIPESPDEEGIEVYDSFQENALAKARYFQRLSGLATVADDSGLMVDALDGKPGVRSKRFAPGTVDLSADERDEANNEYLLEQLEGAPLAERTARYVCVAALVGTGDGKVRTFRGEVEGLILGRPRGWGGFGYDPLFLDRTLGKTFAEISRATKATRSHRGRAFRALATHLREGEAPDT